MNNPPPADPGAAAPETARADLPAAVLWDMDGTLLDSEPYWIAEEHALVERFGGTWSQEHAHELVGNALLDSAAYIRAHTPVDLEPLEIVETLQSGVIRRLEQAVPWRPGALDLLAELGRLGVPCALVTMSWRAMVDAIVAGLPQGSFDVVVTGDEVSRGKPAPDPYLAAAEALGVDVADCVAIEDSETGARSALAAGARTLVVPHVVAVPELPGLARAHTLDGVHARDLLTLTAAQ